MANLDLAIPTIHLNGTSAESLLDQYTIAGGALLDAIRLHDEAAPNARDYYVQGPQAFEQARKQHEDRGARLRSVLTELQAIACAVADGGAS